MKTFRNLSIVVILLVLLFVGSSCIVVTYENEYSLVRQFGKIDHVVSESGVTFKIPFIQSVDKLPKQTLLYDLRASASSSRRRARRPIWPAHLRPRRRCR